MVKDDKKKKADKKARVAQKQEKKSAQKEKKAGKKAKEADDSDAEDADLDAILAEYQKQQEQFLKVTESTCEPPSRRASATLVASPSNTSELILFGGEYFNGALASFFNDLFIYKINTDVWRKVTSPNTPLPRSGHAMCQCNNAVYMFGGEFSSPKQGTFYHYNDFWKLDPGTREWTKLEGKGGPPARSGHRMTNYKHYVILFGGFQDTSSTTKYLQDVWLYDTQRFMWHSPTLPPASQKPDARSSFTLLPHDSGAVLFGGYSRVKATAGAKGAKGAARVTMKPVVHQDSWILRVTTPASDAPVSAAPSIRWERRKAPVNRPNPARAGATMTYHKGRGILFGGVHDVEESDEGIESEFFNQLFAWNIDRNRFFSLALRRPRVSTKKVTNTNEKANRRDRGRADEEELLRNLALIEKGITTDSDTVISESTTLVESEDEASTKIEKPISWEMPLARFNAQLTVQGDTLYIYGGTFESGDREFTFDELWSIDLGKMDGAREVFRREIEDWKGEQSDDEEYEDESDDESNSDEDAVEIVELVTAETKDIAPEPQEVEEEEPKPADPRPQPRPFETLREFFARTSNEWQNMVLEAMKYQRDVEHESVKEIRKRAFDMAEQKWWDMREEIQALEDEQEAAGISEVVNLAERETGNVGKRR